jgi:hypothetical protein
MDDRNRDLLTKKEQLAIARDMAQIKARTKKREKREQQDTRMAIFRDNVQIKEAIARDMARIEAKWRQREFLENKEQAKRKETQRLADRKAIVEEKEAQSKKREVGRKRLQDFKKFSESQANNRNRTISDAEADDSRRLRDKYILA